MSAITPVGAGGALQQLGAVTGARAPGTGESSFAQAISGLLQEANAQQLQSDQSLQQLVTGETDNVHNVVLAVAKADLSFRLVLEIRNRLIDSYQEIMRMQV